MPVFLEFLLIAALIYLWESALWLPKRSHALRRSWFSKKWRVIPATRLLSTRQLGVIPMLIVPPDSGLLPCSAFPIVTDQAGAIFIESPDGELIKTDAISWDQIHFSAPQLNVGSFNVRCQSPATLDSLRKSKSLGHCPLTAIQTSIAQTLSPARAKRNLNRWRIASLPLRVYCPILTLGFFAGIPTAFLLLDPEAALKVAALLWILMLAIGFQLLWIAKSIYPSCRSEIRQDALLSMFIPFHAMRSMEITSVHVFANTHPAAILLASGANDHPWLRSFIRSLLYPRPNHPGDAAQTSTLLPIIEKILRKKNITATDFNTPPNRADDPDASAYCPRCHSMFLKGTETCGDCRQITLKIF